MYLNIFDGLEKRIENLVFQPQHKMYLNVCRAGLKRSLAAHSTKTKVVFKGFIRRFTV